MATRFYEFGTELKHFFMLVIALALFWGIFIPNCSASSETGYRLVTVPFEAAQNDPNYRLHQLIRVSIRKDKPRLKITGIFLFDTGSTNCAISASLATKLGLPLQLMKDRFGKPMELDGKSVFGIIVSSLSIGEFRVQEVPVNVLPDEQLKIGGQFVDGILGGNLWQNLAILLDFTKSQLTFIAPVNPCSYSALASAPIKLTNPEITQLGFDKAITVPLLHESNIYLALFDLTNGPKMETQSLLVDSGAPNTTISEPIAFNLDLQTIDKGNYSGFERYRINVSWLSSLHCGDLSLKNMLVLSPTDYAVSFVPLLGLDVLANYNILFDFPHLKMYLKPRLDVQSVTCRQYEVASSSQRRQWAQGQITVIYPTLNDGYAIPYDVMSNSLPLTQVRPDLRTPSVSFLLKSNANGLLISETLARQWHLKSETVLDDTGKPRLLNGWPVGSATVSNFHISGALAQGQLAVLSDKRISSLTSHLPMQGIIGANFIFLHPVLMDPTTQSWILLNRLRPEDLPSLKMADAAVVDILDPDGDGIPALAVQVQQGDAHSTDTMTLATGSPFTLLSAQAAEALKLTPEPQKLTYGAGKDSTVFNQAHVAQLNIGSVVLQDMPVAYPIGAMPDGFYPCLGMNVISKLRLLVDEPAKKMYVKLAGQAAPPVVSPPLAK